MANAELSCEQLVYCIARYRFSTETTLEEKHYQLNDTIPPSYKEKLILLFFISFRCQRLGTEGRDPLSYACSYIYTKLLDEEFES